MLKRIATIESLRENLAINDRVKLRPSNPDMHTVTAIDPESGTVQLENGEKHALPVWRFDPDYSRASAEAGRKDRHHVLRVTVPEPYDDDSQEVLLNKALGALGIDGSMSVAVKLKELRLRSGQSLQQVADAVRASKAHIWELETGKSTNPSLDLLRRLADHFKVTVASLIGETLEDVPPNIIRMHQDLEDLSERDRALIEDIISNMKKRASTGGADET